MSILTGHVVVITKSPFGQSRSESIRRVTDLGGRVEERVTKATTLLLTDRVEMDKLRIGDKSMSTKSAAAIKRGVRVITGQDLTDAVQGRPLDQVGFLPPVAPSPVSKAAQKRQQRAEAHSLSRRIDGFFAPFPDSPYSAGF